MFALTCTHTPCAEAAARTSGSSRLGPLAHACACPTPIRPLLTHQASAHAWPLSRVSSGWFTILRAAISRADTPDACSTALLRCERSQGQRDVLFKSGGGAVPLAACGRCQRRLSSLPCPPPNTTCKVAALCWPPRTQPRFCITMLQSAYMSAQHARLMQGQAADTYGQGCNFSVHALLYRSGIAVAASQMHATYGLGGVNGVVRAASSEQGYVGVLSEFGTVKAGQSGLLRSFICAPPPMAPQPPYQGG